MNAGNMTHPAFEAAHSLANSGKFTVTQVDDCWFEAALITHDGDAFTAHGVCGAKALVALYLAVANG